MVILFYRVKETLFRKELLTTLFQASGWFPTRKGADMNDFNLSLILIFLILYILKNGSYSNK